MLPKTKAAGFRDSRLSVRNTDSERHTKTQAAIISSPLPRAEEGQGGGNFTAQTRYESPLPNPPLHAGEGTKKPSLPLDTSFFNHRGPSIDLLFHPRAHLLRRASLRDHP
jgi:hypothetical protein